MEEGWRVHARGNVRTGHYWYVNPAGERFQNRNEAVSNSGRRGSTAHAPAVPEAGPPSEQALADQVPACGVRVRACGMLCVVASLLLYLTSSAELPS